MLAEPVRRDGLTVEARDRRVEAQRLVHDRSQEEATGREARHRLRFPSAASASTATRSWSSGCSLSTNKVQLVKLAVVS